MPSPITAFYAGLLAILFFYLSVRVILIRGNKKIGLGDNGDRHVLQLIRAHGNFSEYTPLILVLMLIAELNASHSLLLHGCGVALLLGRFFHAVGLNRHAGSSWQRILGMILTFSALLSAAVANLLIAY
jgi:uncharacterized protein